MARFRITAPVRGYTGELAGVYFANGVAEVDDTAVAALAYCRRRGYTVEQLDQDEPAKGRRAPAKKAAPKKAAADKDTDDKDAGGHGDTDKADGAGGGSPAAAGTDQAPAGGQRATNEGAQQS